MTKIKNIYAEVNIEQYHIPHNRYIINAETIHSSLIKGLIPVTLPVFLDVDGNSKPVQTEFVIKIDVDYNEFDKHILQIISRAIDIATEKRWKYLHSIFLDTIDYKLFVRGC